MSPLTLIRDLRMHLRAWERHHIRFGVVCSRYRLPLCKGLFSDVCVGAGTEELSILANNETDVALSVMVTDDSLIYRFPHGHRNRRQRGKRNPHFLRGKQLQKALRGMRVPVQTVIFSVAHIYQTEEVTPGMLVGHMERFFRKLPGRFHYGVELQNRRYLLPEYVDLLVRHGITHVLNDSVTMPPLLDQIQIPQILTSDPVIVRTTASKDPVWQLGILETVRRCVDEKKELFIYLMDGEILDASLMEMMELLTPDLAKLSPLRKRAA